ncbi:MAG: flavin reductase family protein [Pseudomonadales bacterium]|nr:flavin reductase family protein [Pseudomonadales bacterium]
MHKLIEPSILYFGTPTVIVSTLNDDGSTNLAPISAVWWLGWSCMLGLDASSQTTLNLINRGECVLNLASVHNVEAINKLALTTGKSDVPMHKKMLGYRSVEDKFALAELTPLDAIAVDPKRVKECDIHLEGRVAKIHDFAISDARMGVPAVAVEVTVEHIHALSSLLYSGSKVDPNKWNPLIMNFRELYGLSGRLGDSNLAARPEFLYAPWKFGFLGRLLRRMFFRQYKS